MSDKQIVERNGVSMDRHSSGNEVPPFSYETVRITASANVPASEVETAKKAVLARYPMATSRGSCHTGEAWRYWIEFAGKNSTSFPTEDAAWLDAASKLPAPLTEDAPKCEVCPHDLHEGACEDENCLCTQYPSIRGIKVPASPVGEREGEFENSAFEAWISTTVGFTGDDVLFAHAGWNARAALASNPSPEGIPERPKPETAKQFETMLTRISFVQYAEFKRWADKVEALLSAKDAEIAAFRETNRTLNRRVGALEKCVNEQSEKSAWYRYFWVALDMHSLENSRAHAAEAELSALKLSSARVRDEALREAAKVAMEVYGECPESGYMKEHLDRLWDGACSLIQESILSLIPTSPESQPSPASAVKG